MSVSPAVAQVCAAVDATLAADPRATPEVWRLAEVEQLLTAVEQLRAAVVDRLTVIDTDETSVAVTGRATRSWLVEEQNVAPGEAAAIVRLARMLPGRPVTAQALRAGRIRVDHACAITRALGQVPAPHVETVESALVDLAADVPAPELGGYVETLLVACGVEPSADRAAARRLEKRGLTIAATFDGMRAVSGLLTPETGEALETAVRCLAERAGEEDDRSPAQRRHDAVGELAQHYLAHADVPAVTGRRPRVVVTIGLDALLGRLENAWGSLPSGATVSPGTARRLACDAEVIPAVLGGRGEVVDVATTSRTFPTAVRRAAWLEQQGRCAYPRCRRPPADCHHVVWWVNGGRSTLANAAWLCAFHHWLVHERGWTMRRNPDRSFAFMAPAGGVAAASAAGGARSP